MNKKNLTLNLATAAVVGAAYAALTVLLAPISYGAVQLRVSEVLCILPFFLPGTAWGLYAGCLLANLLTGNIMDILFGSLATLLAALCTARFGRKTHTLVNRLLACLMPVIFNAVIVGAVIVGAYEGLNLFSHLGVWAAVGASVGAGELAVLLILGLPLTYWLDAQPWFSAFAARLNGAQDRAA